MKKITLFVAKILGEFSKRVKKSPLFWCSWTGVKEKNRPQTAGFYTGKA